MINDTEKDNALDYYPNSIATLRLGFDRGRFGRIEAHFMHQHDPYHVAIFVEDRETRERGTTGPVALSCHLHEELAPGRYVLRGVKATYHGGGEDGKEIYVPYLPFVAFDLVPRGKPPKLPETRVTEATLS